MSSTSRFASASPDSTTPRENRPDTPPTPRRHTTSPPPPRRAQPCPFAAAPNRNWNSPPRAPSAMFNLHPAHPEAPSSFPTVHSPLPTVPHSLPLPARLRPRPLLPQFPHLRVDLTQVVPRVDPRAVPVGEVDPEGVVPHHLGAERRERAA